MKPLRLILLSIAILLLGACSTSRSTVAIDYPKVDSGYNYQGILEEQIYECSVEGPKERRMFVYLPQDYYSNTDSYPVFYLLHGARGNETSWMSNGDLLQNIDSLTTNGLMKECIVVLPNTNQHNDDEDYGKSRIKGAVESFFENDGRVEYSFVNDVVKKIDTTYRTIPEKGSRAIAGLSIGALQSLHISANHPDTFGYIGLFSPMVHPFIIPSEHSSFFKELKKKQKIQFATPPELYWIMIGKTDFFYPRINCYHKQLKRKGYKHEYLATPGGHQWYNWEEYCIMFMKRLWK